MIEINSLHSANQVPSEKVSLVSRQEIDGMERRAADTAQSKQDGINFNALVWQSSLIFPLSNFNSHTSTVVTVGLCSVPTQQ